MRIKTPSKPVILIVSVTIAIVTYFTMVSQPLRRERAALQGALATTEREIASATEELAALRQRRAIASTEEVRFAWEKQLRESIKRPYMVEAPARFLRAFRNHGLENVEVSLAQLLPFPKLAEFAVAKWQLRLPKARVLPLGEALASLENDFPLGNLRILEVRRQDATGVSEVTLEFETAVQP